MPTLVTGITSCSFRKFSSLDKFDLFLFTVQRRMYFRIHRITAPGLIEPDENYENETLEKLSKKESQKRIFLSQTVSGYIHDRVELPRKHQRYRYNWVKDSFGLYDVVLIAPLLLFVSTLRVGVIYRSIRGLPRCLDESLDTRHLLYRVQRRSDLVVRR